MRGHGFLLIYVFPNKDRIADSIFTRENKRQRKSLFWHILRSVSTITNIKQITGIYRTRKLWIWYYPYFALTCVLLLVDLC